MRNILTQITKLSMISLLLATQASANTLYIKNNDSAKVNIVVEPGKGTITPSSPAVKQVVKPGEELTLTINRELLDNADTFSIKGTVNVPSPNNKCGPLSIDQDYKITFTSGKLGVVVCNYEVVS